MACAASLQADPITGTTGFTGSFSAANPDLTTTADVLTITTASLNGIPTGSFVGGVLTGFTPSVTINNPVNPTFTNPLWQVTVGSHIFDFNSTSNNTITDTMNINTITGTGIVTDSSDGDTANGTYNMSFNVTQAGAQATFTWNGTTGATPSVPDSGTTALLLGIALSGLGIIRRKLA